MSKRCMGCMELYKDIFDVCPHCGYIEGSAAREALFMEPGTLLYDRYIVGNALGFGGFGVTYIGWDGKLEQKVAIKEYLPTEFSTRMPGRSKVTVFNGNKREQFDAGLEKFVEEAKSLAKFQNEPGIVRVFDSFIENDTAYIVMEFLEGETLTARLNRDKTIPAEEAIEMLLPVMNSLKVVHAAGILHRDLAPDNIFLTKDGSVKLIDFGASRYATTSHSRSLTVIIKQGYSPEEQYRSRGDHGPYTDIYALSATLYKMITGVTPPDAMERRSKFEGSNKDLLVEPHKIQESIDVNIENAILNGMNVRIEDRTPDLETFIDELTSKKLVKRRQGKIKKIDVFAWPLWLKILVPSILCVCLTFGVLLATDVIKFESLFSTEVVIPEGVVQVPDVETLSMDEAIKLIEESQLLVNAGGNVESEYVDAGIIIIQTPTGGSFAEVNSEVVLTVSSGVGVTDVVDGLSTVPYVVWDKLEDAIKKLKKAGLASPKIEKREDDTVDKGKVISQSIEVGKKVKEGTQITIVVSTGPKPFGMISVVGYDVYEAKTKLENLGLNVSLSYQKNDDVEEGKVITQSVNSGESVNKGDSVILYISSGKNIITVVNVVGFDSETAISNLKDQKLNVNVLENYSSDVPAGKVISQTPAAGAGLMKGDTVVIYVSKGKQPVSVSFNPTGGSVNTGSKTVYLTASYGELPVPQKNGYSFDGWFTSNNGGSRVTKDTIVSNSASHTLYAHWSAKNYTVSFDPNGGELANNYNKSVLYGAEYGTLPTPTKQGHTFDGWYTSLSNGSNIKASTIVNTASNHKLVAKWKAKTYVITFNANGGSVSQSNKNVTYGSQYGSLPTATKNYYTFNGWYTASSGGSKVSASTLMEASNVTLYARWTSKPLSGWVLESNVPSGAQVVNEKWTYSKTETTTSTSSSMSGWTQTGSSWQQTGSGVHCFASFPSGFNTSDSRYTKYNGSAISAYENSTTKRTVSDQNVHSYVYYHWAYDNPYFTYEENCYVADAYNKNVGNGYKGVIWECFESTTNSTTYSQNCYKYTGHSNHSWWWFKITVYEQSYVDYQKVYTYSRTTQGESSTVVYNGGSISNVKKYVQYREK